LDEIARKTDTTAHLLQESELAAPRLLALRAKAQAAEPIYTIVRPSESGSIEIQATEITEIEPGDTLKVEIPLPDISPTELGLTSPFAGSLAEPLAQASPRAFDSTN
jgi:polysaccharide export outer membrane protein/exopolysaccharide production protein ExoF